MMCTYIVYISYLQVQCISQERPYSGSQYIYIYIYKLSYNNYEYHCKQKKRMHVCI